MKIINITLFVLVSCVFSTHAYTISNHVAVEYHIVAGSYTWDEAIAECASLGGTLARIPDKRTDDFITQYIRDSGLGDQVDTGFWIGLNDRNEEDNFKWINGGEVCYTNWGEGEPDNNTNKNPQGQDCGQLRKTTDFKWDDEYCTGVDIREKGFICEVQGMLVCSKCPEP
uniref:Macrophage mannose receptor 1-like n=1 Tax=Saccoglossus kowalevskii TaxID=10224 RepID=A0ABM0MV40_SACKO|nr:PREDICTED: macrophage mannose receptor 1-like [Saccoglossus kowalevskii]